MFAIENHYQDQQKLKEQYYQWLELEKVIQSKEFRKQTLTS